MAAPAHLLSERKTGFFVEVKDDGIVKSPESSATDKQKKNNFLILLKT